jgi:hypothetical protein
MPLHIIAIGCVFIQNKEHCHVCYFFFEISHFVKFVLIHFKPKMESEENFKVFLFLIIFHVAHALGILLVANLYKNKYSRIILGISALLESAVVSLFIADFTKGMDHSSSKVNNTTLLTIVGFVELIGLFVPLFV